MLTYSRLEILEREGAVVRHFISFSPSKPNLTEDATVNWAGENQPGFVRGEARLGVVCRGCTIYRGQVPGVACTSLSQGQNREGETVWTASLHAQEAGERLPLAVVDPHPEDPTVSADNHDYFMAQGLVPPCQSAEVVESNKIP